jgi:hypothetical protein
MTKLWRRTFSQALQPLVPIYRYVVTRILNPCLRQALVQRIGGILQRIGDDLV